MRMVIFSVLLIAVIIFRREGILGMREFSWSWFFPRRRRKEAEGGGGSFALTYRAPAPLPKGGPLLEVRDLTLRFGGLTAVDGLSLDVEEGAIAGLIGPNGAGKTSAFNAISGFYRPASGSVRFMGRDITGRPPHEVCREGIPRTFQNIRLFANETALQNVMVGAWVRRRTYWWMSLLPFVFTDVIREETGVRQCAQELLGRLGLASYANERASALPYGAQRRLEIARALGTAPRLLLLDEPAAGMNPQESSELMQFIRRLRDEFHLTILLIEHDMKVVMNVCDTIHVLDQGRLIARGTPEEIRRDPGVIEAYLGAGAAQKEGA